jgi:acyl-CoA reductase-like NAD-dependent aldehyde dehydrogenase
MRKIINPATEQEIAQIEEFTRQDVAAAYVKARSVSESWALTPYLQRAEVVSNFRQLLAKHREEAALTLTKEMGKPLSQARNELGSAIERIDWFLAQTPRYLAGETVRVAPPMTEEISYEPLGVLGNISAWNYPYLVGINVMIPAVLTGNVLLYKPSEFVSMTGQFIGMLWQESGAPEGVFSQLPGGGTVGQALCEQALDGMFFTGSYGTGRVIAEKLAGRFIPTCFELGGKDAAYVCDEVQVEAAVESLVDGAFYNAGQSCCAIERIYVHYRVYEEFLSLFAELTKKIKMGDPLVEDTYLGPLTRPQQRAVLDAQVADALAKGARQLVAGGAGREKGYFYSPAVLADTTHQMTIMREESFGPIIGIAKVAGDAEAVALINDSSYGLTSSIYSRSEEHARSLGRRLNTGTVYWNCCDRVSPYLPWSGRQHSGLGSTLSHLGIKAFLRPKAWHLKNNRR